jgi:hypothetical protein
MICQGYSHDLSGYLNSGFGQYLLFIIAESQTRFTLILRNSLVNDKFSRYALVKDGNIFLKEVCHG